MHPILLGMILGLVIGLGIRYAIPFVSSHINHKSKSKREILPRPRYNIGAHVIPHWPHGVELSSNYHCFDRPTTVSCVFHGDGQVMERIKVVEHYEDQKPTESWQYLILCESGIGWVDEDSIEGHAVNHC